ncbi:gliding motility-associated ABC transporter permease subunit GldF [Pseudochryseolinea flava]|uniref:Gliding motility-associated ABC transporter permease subunit GldF n=1 Tax=Pseudochryseolinea flava TaxID=2059302 RepID=A0A364Y6T3_9BACT|nr:gliding motility-associated ABC transporter permease subunit GldF [Pseudochryseolinea flava]RAW01808.1 gliding motility-associated ABC transporter permease subunit GldF [Pseudochryseolinea flava]
MVQVLFKEFNSFLNSLIAYIVIGVFLTGIGLLMWVFPETAVPDSGYAQMDTLFTLGPFVFIFLVPAITMRSFAEEKKGGTMELLLTKPLSDWQILLGKFFACFILVLFALVPTILYYFSIYQLGNPVGNIDTPGIMGSYIGLALLAAVFCAAGIFASSITPNQIIAFIVAAFLCFILFTGFDSLSALIATADNAFLVKQLGLNFHYESMSKGLIDSRDILYFLSVIFLLLSCTRLTLGSRQW